MVSRPHGFGGHVIVIHSSDPGFLNGKKCDRRVYDADTIPRDRLCRRRAVEFLHMTHLPPRRRDLHNGISTRVEKQANGSKVFVCLVRGMNWMTSHPMTSPIAPATLPVAKQDIERWHWHYWQRSRRGAWY